MGIANSNRSSVVYSQYEGCNGRKVLVSTDATVTTHTLAVELEPSACVVSYNFPVAVDVAHVYHVVEP